MTNASTTDRRDPLTVAREKRGSGKPGYLVIAQGTPFEIGVRDARSSYTWSKPSGERQWDTPRGIVYHHTASGPLRRNSQKHQVEWLAALAHGSEWGLPYNFVIETYAPHRIYYINDVDRMWPHTLHFNHYTAIAAVGNYSLVDPPPSLVRRMVGLADALATMWGEWLPEIQHRDVMPTECPGVKLAPLLPAMDRQRGV